MNQNNQLFQINLGAIRNWLIVLGIVWLLGSVGLGWVVNSILILLAFLLLTPAIAFLFLRWWLSRNLIEDKCPVCNHEFAALNQTQCQCPNCGEPLQVEGGNFIRLTPPGTVDVTAVEVTSYQLEEDNNS